MKNKLAFRTCTPSYCTPIQTLFPTHNHVCWATFNMPLHFPSAERQTGRLSDCQSAVITFTAPHWSASPQTPGKLPLTFVFEKKKKKIRLCKISPKLPGMPQLHLICTYSSCICMLCIDGLDYLLLLPQSLPQRPPSTWDAPSSLMWIYDAVRERVVEACLLLSHVGLNEQAPS